MLTLVLLMKIYLNEIWKKKRIYQGLLSLTLLIGILFGITVPSTANSCIYHEEAYRGLKLINLLGEIEGTGLIGNIHGAVPSSQMFVLSVREPDNFFSHREFSLLTREEDTLAVLKTVSRHDRVCVQGKLLENASPQKHILVTSIKVEKKWSGEKNLPPDERETAISSDLMNQTSLVGKVHAIGAGGQLLVIEYQDKILPIYVSRANEYTQNLFRGDIIEFSYQIQENPSHPTHLRLNLETEKPVKVLDAIADWHQQEKSLTGKLVKFPKSPQIAFDVYAIEVETRGLNRYFTLVNFEDEQEFQKLRDKLARIWDSNRATAIVGRNMLINPQVTMEVQGTINVISPEQANPQILISKAEDCQQKR